MNFLWTFWEILWKFLQRIKICSENFQKVHKKTPLAKSYFRKVPSFYISSHRSISIKKVFLERCSQNSQENTCLRDSILIKLLAKGCKKEMLARVFSCEFSENSKNTFFTEHLRTTASAFSFSESATGGVLWKKVFLQILQNSQKNTCGLLNFQEQLFFRAPFLNFLTLDDCFWFSPATLLRWVTANSVWKTSDEYSLSRNTNLSRQHKFSVYAFIGLHCLLPEAATRVEMFCKKGVLKNFVNFIGKHLSWSLFLINCRPETYFEEHLSTTAFHYTHTTSLLFISFTLYSAPSSSALLLLLISPMFVFGSKSESFKEFKSGVSFSVLGKIFPGKFPPITLLLESSTQTPPPPSPPKWNSHQEYSHSFH